MTSLTSVKGKCLCGAVEVNCKLASDSFGACHCGTCRKWHGASALGIEGKEVQFKGENAISVFSSSEWAERGFCKHCGTHLFYRLKAGGFINLPLGLLENTEHLNFNFQIFIDKKPENYSFANQTTNLTEKEFLAKFASK